MTPTRTSSFPETQALPAQETRTVLRAKTVATRLTPEELAEVEAAAERDQKTVAEWLREIALRTARQRSADCIEILLAEQMATRYALLNLFHATALANSEGKQLLPDSVLKIRDQADAQKLVKARKTLQESLGNDGGRDGGQK
jgi:hypothetical protein